MKNRTAGLLVALVVGVAGWRGTGRAATAADSGKATLIKTTGTAKVYLVVGGRKRWVQTSDVFTACGLAFKNVVAVPEAVTASVPPGDDLASASDCTAAKALPAFPDGTLVQATGDAKVHLTVGGLKRWIQTSDIFRSGGLSFSSVVKLPADVVATIADGPVIDSAAELAKVKVTPSFANGTLIQGPGAAVYLVEAGSKRWVQTSDVFTSCGLDWKNVKKTSEADLAKVPLGPTLTSADECKAAKGK